MITHVAIIYKGTLYSLPKPNRHHDVIRLIHESTGNINICGEEGFLCFNSFFMNRKQALIQAQLNNQIIEKTYPLDELFSEDIW